ncbi:MAG: alanine-tRNA synthetase second additional domain-containing protein [Oscillospiraceae bacterium]|nr:alanine-tRNA synthetase second additional domain-containing protein [Oscillospiraceae bacterium]
MLPASILQNNHLCSIYFAPRGRDRLYSLGMQIAQQYLTPFDKLIGVIGEAGSGKSVLTKAMFPGLELTNDDNGVNIRPLPLLDQDAVQRGFYSPHTYHVDIRFEMGFTQPFELADAILQTVRKGKRVVVEHFDLIYPFLMGTNAQLLIGIGEEVIVTRPTIFGPDPQELAAIVHKSVAYRKMAHTAEDLCEFYMPEGLMDVCHHGDVRHGFVMAFDHVKPDLDLAELEKKVSDAIARNVTIDFVDETHITIDGQLHDCTGPRTHVHTTGEIKNFRLEHEFRYDHLSDQYLLIGHVGEHSNYTEILSGLL